MKDNCLVVFAKAPVVGEVKTRLASSVGAERAAKLYIDMAQSVYRAVRELPEVFTAVAYQSHTRYPDLVWLDPADPGYLEQRGETLGERMRHAFDWALRSGAKRVILLGSDSPGLPTAWIEEGFARLAEKDLVLGPTEDGGYYLFGACRLYPELFKDIAWSTPETYAQTVDAARRLKLSLHELSPYFDVDDEATLKRWLSSARRDEN